MITQGSILTRFDARHPEGESPVVETSWELTDHDMRKIAEEFGENAISSRQVFLSAGLDYLPRWTIAVNEPAIIKALVNHHELYKEVAEPLLKLETVTEAKKLLDNNPDRTPEEEAMLNEIDNYPESQVEKAIINSLAELMPKMFYTSHYDRMSGKISVNQLDNDRSNGEISRGRSDIS